jgi:hypothetical protein
VRAKRERQRQGAFKKGEARGVVRAERERQRQGVFRKGEGRDEVRAQERPETRCVQHGRGERRGNVRAAGRGQVRSQPMSRGVQAGRIQSRGACEEKERVEAEASCVCRKGEGGGTGKVLAAGQRRGDKMGREEKRVR